MATDLAYKNRLLRGDLTYKVTAGPNGTHILHLYSTPGSKLTFGSTFTANGALSLVGCEVWYTYYDVSNADDADKCRRDNPEVIITPDQVPLEKMDYAFFNAPTKTIVRKLFFAKAKEALGNVRGKFSGKINIMEAEANLDYMMLINQGQTEYKDTMEELTKRLERMSPYEIMKKNAELTQNMVDILKQKPMGIFTV